VQIRELEARDEDALRRFLDAIPPRDRAFSKEDAAEPAVVRHWIDDERGCGSRRWTTTARWGDRGRVAGGRALEPRGRPAAAVAAGRRREGLGRSLAREALGPRCGAGCGRSASRSWPTSRGTIDMFLALGFVAEALLRDQLGRRASRRGRRAALAPGDEAGQSVMLARRTRRSRDGDAAAGARRRSARGRPPAPRRRHAAVRPRARRGRPRRPVQRHRRARRDVARRSSGRSTACASSPSTRPAPAARRPGCCPPRCPASPARGGALRPARLERADLLGYSFGGALAQEFAARHPDRVRRLVLAATVPGWGGVPGRLTAMLSMGTPLRYYSRPVFERTAPTIAGGRARHDRDLRAADVGGPRRLRPLPHGLRAAAVGDDDLVGPRRPRPHPGAPRWSWRRTTTRWSP
jgi:hypothetical protein